VRNTPAQNVQPTIHLFQIEAQAAIGIAISWQTEHLEKRHHKHSTKKCMTNNSSGKPSLRCLWRTRTGALRKPGGSD